MRRIWVVFWLLAVVQIASAEEVPIKINLNPLVAPSTPAFTLLGVDPDIVVHPASYNDLQASVRNTSNDFTEIPSNYAIEFNLGRLLIPEGMNLDRLSGEGNTQADLLDRIQVSVGSTSDSTVIGHPGIRMAIGFRLAILQGELNQASVQAAKDQLHFAESMHDSLLYWLGSVNELKSLMQIALRQSASRSETEVFALADSLRVEIKELEHVSSADREVALAAMDLQPGDDGATLQSAAGNAIRVLSQTDSKRVADVTAVLNQIFDNQITPEEAEQLLAPYLTRSQLQTALDAARFYLETYPEVIIERAGPQLEFASAAAYDLADETGEETEFVLWASWITYNLRVDESFSLLATGRGMRDELAKTTDLDVGIRGQFTKYEGIAAGLEGALRFGYADKTDTFARTTYQVLGNLSYSIGDHQVIAFTFGREFMENGRANTINRLSYSVGFMKSFTDKLKIPEFP